MICNKHPSTSRLILPTTHPPTPTHCSFSFTTVFSIVCFSRIVLHKNTKHIIRDLNFSQVRPLINIYNMKEQIDYQGIWSVSIAKHHSLLILLVDIIIWRHFSRIMSTNPQIVHLYITSHDWICNAFSGTP